MNMKTKFIAAIALCSSAFFAKTLVAQTYQQDLRAWYQVRNKNLTADNGWLNLAGLFWLKEGRNTFGSGSNADIKFAGNGIPAAAGYFELKQGVVIQYASAGSSILVDGRPAQEAV